MKPASERVREMARKAGPQRSGWSAMPDPFGDGLDELRRTLEAALVVLDEQEREIEALRTMLERRLP